MLRPSRRRSLNAGQLCAGLTAVLLLLSLSLLHFRLSNSPFPLSLPLKPQPYNDSSSLFDDADNDAFDGQPDDDRIDVLDLIDQQQTPDSIADEEQESDEPASESESESDSPSLFWDHALAVHRRSFGKLESDPIPFSDDPLSLAFSSDDLPLDDRIRSMLHSVRSIEDLLMVKTNSDNPLRDGWSRWLEGKGDFLRRDRMLKSNLESLNPRNHPLLQDPDVIGLSGYTRGDRLVQRSILKEMEKVPFPGSEKRVKRGEMRRNLQLEKKERDGNGRRWGYFPGIEEGVSFSEFMERFFGSGDCGIRVVTVWNSPSWMFGVRHQRGVESVLKVHKDACVVVLSETMEMDFFESFVKDG